MDNNIKINASVVSHPGIGYSSVEDNFYINGRYRYEHECEAIQVSVENSGEEYVLAVTDCMDRISSLSDRKASISMVRELKKFQEDMKGKGGDAGSKLNELAERIKEANNVIYSMSINSSDREKAPSLSAIYLSNTKATGISLGSCKTYLLRDGNFGHLAGASTKAEKLLKMGIITNEQAKVLSGKFGINVEEDESKLHKSGSVELKDGDLFLMCSDGLCGTVDDEKLHEIITSDRETGVIANKLVREALKNGVKTSVTAMVVRVENIQGSSNGRKPGDGYFHKRLTKAPGVSRNIKIRVLAAVAAVCVMAIIAGMFVFMQPWKSFSTNTDSGKANAALPTIPGRPEGNLSTGDNINDGNLDNDVLPDDGTGENDGTEGSLRADGKIYHSVQPGDSLGSISKKYYDDPSKYTIIMEKNGISNPNQLQIGQELEIPPAN